MAHDPRYAIERSKSTGLLIISFEGVKIGSAQTYAAACLIRRNHRRNLEQGGVFYPDMTHPY